MIRLNSGIEFELVFIWLEGFYESRFVNPSIEVIEDSDQCERNFKLQNGRIEPLLVPTDNTGIVTVICPFSLKNFDK